MDTAGLDERDIVKGWLVKLGRVSDQQVLVHRGWGTVTAVVGDDGGPAAVFWSDGDTTWHAVPPEAIKDTDLTPEQVTYVVLDALTSSGPSEWPQWRVLR